MRVVRFVGDDAEPRYGVLDEDEVDVITPHPFGDFEPAHERVPVEGLRLLAPTIPTKVIGVGRNFADHAEEIGADVADEAVLFLKPSSAVIGPGESIAYPTGHSGEVHHEAEVAVVIRRLLRDAEPGECADGVLGITAANDVTARDLQRRDEQWGRAKGFDTFCPLGPAVASEPDWGNIGVRGYVDGELRQEGNTADLVHSIPQLLSLISRVMTLLPTDVVLTGTPAGVGPVEPGQDVRVEVDGVGSLTNPVVEREAARQHQQVG